MGSPQGQFGVNELKVKSKTHFKSDVHLQAWYSEEKEESGQEEPDGVHDFHEDDQTGT